ncbi:MAG: alpha/beta hydrolase [Chloroflexota bacterium]|nr:alpha/beta hydrolase [Chloroflexota bacterium]
MRHTFAGEIDINGARLHVTVTGEGAPVVLVHSGITDSRMWDAQVVSFSTAYWVVTYDLRNFGRSTIPADDYAHHEDLRSLLDATDIASATLVGASFGGKVALAVTVEYPTRIDALVLVNTLAGMTEPSPGLRSGWRAVEAALDSESFDDAVEVELQMWVDGPHRSATQVDQVVRERVREMDAALLRRAAEQDAATESELDPPVLERLGTISTPVRVVVDALDLPDALTNAVVLGTGMPGARRFDIPGAAHLPSVECPGVFNPAVLSFIDDVNTSR